MRTYVATLLTGVGPRSLAADAALLEVGEAALGMVSTNVVAVSPFCRFLDA